MTPRTSVLGIIAVSLAVTFILWLLGKPWVGDFYSQRIIDWWAWSHFGHGIVFYAVAKVFWPHESVWWLLFVIVCVEGLWEIAENTETVIDLFRSRGDKGYEGDSLVNSFVDRLSCFIGACITAWMLYGTVPVN